ncbi:MAG TPA: TIGR03013 family XrtA/PEP-CTERM system glycosyltransferase [Vicinamibacterales bacterium]|nr:TIGR03013 family XrtA/PEP-CTERM system glycosyltransferase [Vicinamibacterales bacterium]
MALLLNQRVTWRTATLIACESCLIAGAVGVSADWWRPGSLETAPLLGKALLVAAVCQLSLYYGDLYDLRRIATWREFFSRLLQSLGAAALVLGTVYAVAPGLVLATGVFATAVALVITAVTGWRLVFDWVSRHLGPRERLLIVGTSPAAVTLARELYERKELGVELVGFVHPDPAMVGMPVINPGVIGTIDDIPRIVHERRIHRVVVSLADARGQLPMQRLLDVKLRGSVAFDHLASVYEEYTGKIAVENLRPSWLIFSSGFRRRSFLMALKRAIDIVAGAAGLILLAPLMAVVAVLVKLSSRGPALYHQERVGRDGRVFTVHKFRSMRADAESATGAVWARANDDRVFPLGRLMRKTRLDELPQLFNVLTGDMSLVGPRPERPQFVSQLTEQIPFYGQRHVVKPGLTGWAQVRYTYGASVEDAMQKLQYDLFYIKNLSLALDLYIALKTIKIVLLRRGAQ